MKINIFVSNIAKLILLTPIVLHGIIPHKFFPDFNESMSWNEYYNQSLTNNITARILYDQYLKEISWNEPALIPKIVHHIWLGDELPKKEASLFDTWLKHHPHWHHVLWVDNPKNYQFGSIIINSITELEQLVHNTELQGKVIIVDLRTINFDCQDLIKQARNYGEKSDILRYEILCKVGGLYVDTDCECLKPFDILHHTCKFIIGMYLGGKIMNSLIASQPYSPILRVAIYRLKKSKNDNLGTFGKTGPDFLSQCIFDYLSIVNSQDHSGIVLFPITYFYPIPHFDRLKKTKSISQWIREETFAIHHWHCAWM